MSENEIIGKAFEELAESPTSIIMLRQFSFTKDLENDPQQFQRIRMLLVNAEPFARHTDHALKFSPRGIEIKTIYGSWEKYVKSKKKKLDWIQLGILIVGAVTIVWNIIWSVFLFNQNNALEKEVEQLKKEINSINK